MDFLLLKGFLTDSIRCDMIFAMTSVFVRNISRGLGLKLSGFLFIIFFNFTARATITITGFETQSFSAGEGKLLNGNNSTNTHTIYGGYSGTCETYKDSVVCNSCNGEFPCNIRRIHDNLILTLFFTTTEAGPILITTDSDDDQILLDNVLGPTGDVAANSTVRVGIRWQQICQLLFDGTSGCGHEEALDRGTRAIRIGIDSNRDGKFSLDNSTEYTSEVRLAVLNIDDEMNYDGGTIPLCSHNSISQGLIVGACNFSLYPGDEKVFVENVRGSCDFPSVGNNQARAVRVFYRATSGEHGKAESFTDFPVGNSDSECDQNTKVITLAQNEVSGLVNGQEYFFAIGVVDKAENVGFVTENCFRESGGQQCHSATPFGVGGVTEEEFDCFITTATYGGSLHPKVKTFRKFRNRFLKTNRLGRIIIKNYYLYSPPLAQWITDHPGSRVFWKILLWPFWLFAEICLKWFFPVSSVFLFFIFFINRKKRSLKVKT